MFLKREHKIVSHQTLMANLQKEGFLLYGLYNVFQEGLKGETVLMLSILFTLTTVTAQLKMC